MDFYFEKFVAISNTLIVLTMFHVSIHDFFFIFLILIF